MFATVVTQLYRFTLDQGCIPIRIRYYCLTERVQISSTSSKLSSIYIVEIEVVIDIGMRKGRK